MSTRPTKPLPTVHSNSPAHSLIAGYALISGLHEAHIIERLIARFRIWRRYLSGVIGFEITLTGGEARQVTAEHYSVSELGALEFFGGGALVETIKAGAWERVDGLGTRLAETWPSPELDRVMEKIATRLGAHWGYFVWALRDPSTFEAWQLNDLDELTTAVFKAIGEDSSSSDIRDQVDDIRHLVSRGFHLEQ